MEFTIKIDAPGLEGAIHTLAQVLANYEMPVNIDGGQAVATLEAQPAQQAPVQQHQVPQQQAQPTQQFQQAPEQQAPEQQYQQPQGVPVAQQPQQAPPVQQQQSSVPTSSPAYSMDQLARAASQLMDAGKQNELVQLLGQFGVQALTALPQEQYGAFATKLRELGANL